MMPRIPDLLHAPLRLGRLLAPALLTIALLLAPLPACAHAILVDSTPPALGQAPAGQVAFRLSYNSRIDAARSRLLLIRPDKTETVLPVGPDSAANVLTATATLAAGAYTLRWQVLAVDGHITRGDLPFTVTGR